MLTLSLIGGVLAGAIVGVLAYMVRTNTGFTSIDHDAARWAAAHVGSATVRILTVITDLGATATIIGVAVTGALYGARRWRTASVPFFFALVVGGQLLLSNLIKFTVDRARPGFRPLAGFSGPSFPSGHATAAAATYAALALILTRGRTPSVRAAFGGTAVAIASAVACSRVLLGAHWVSDVVAGLALGWAWFGLCAVAFGGRLLHFGAPAEEAVRPSAPTPMSTPHAHDRRVKPG
jgi:undecaprenyl-diphosphatase